MPSLAPSATPSLKPSLSQSSSPSEVPTLDPTDTPDCLVDDIKGKLYWVLFGNLCLEIDMAAGVICQVKIDFNAPTCNTGAYNGQPRIPMSDLVSPPGEFLA